MTEGATTHSRHLLGLRKQHPAWRLLAARTGPPVIATLKALEDELYAANRGEVEVLSEQSAVEAIREVYTLAMSLRNDFRRVEDSYRAADRRLRESVVSQDSHRGQIVDSLLDSHDALLQTDEGRVFDSFQQQLTRSLELENMRLQIRALSHRPEMRKALSRDQQTELRWLVMRLVRESAVVIAARERSERDVKGFLHTGLASEHHRVGQLLNDIFACAAGLDWSRQALRRAPAPLPPVGFGNSGLPLVERLRFKGVDEGLVPMLELVEQTSDLDQMDDEFWSAFDALDRQALLNETRRLLDDEGRAMTIAEIALRLPNRHDLESLALWLTLALEAELPLDETELLELSDEDGAVTRFTLPRVALDTQILADIELEL